MNKPGETDGMESVFYSICDYIITWLDVQVWSSPRSQSHWYQAEHLHIMLVITGCSADIVVMINNQYDYAPLFNSNYGQFKADGVCVCLCVTLPVGRL